MLGERALDLVREAKRSQDMLGPYNEDKVSDLKKIFIQNKFSTTWELDIIDIVIKSVLIEHYV